jgi:hypothetical protein
MSGWMGTKLTRMLAHRGAKSGSNLDIAKSSGGKGTECWRMWGSEGAKSAEIGQFLAHFCQFYDTKNAVE